MKRWTKVRGGSIHCKSGVVSNTGGKQLDTIRMRQVTALVDALFDPQNKNIYANDIGI